MLAEKVVAESAIRDTRASLQSLQVGRGLAALSVWAFHLSVLLAGRLGAAAGSI